MSAAACSLYLCGAELLYSNNVTFSALWITDWMTNAVNFCLLEEPFMYPKHDTSDVKIWQKQTPASCVIILQQRPNKGNAQSEVFMGVLLLSYRPTWVSSSLSFSFFFLFTFFLKQPKRNPSSLLVCTSLPQQTEEKNILKRKTRVAPEKAASQTVTCAFM